MVASAQSRAMEEQMKIFDGRVDDTDTLLFGTNHPQTGQGVEGPVGKAEGVDLGSLNRWGVRRGFEHVFETGKKLNRLRPDL